MTEKKYMANLQKAHNTPHRYSDMPYEYRADELRKALRKYLLRKEPA